MTMEVLAVLGRFVAQESLRQVSLGTDYPLYNPLTLGLAYVMLYVMIHSMKKKT